MVSKPELIKGAGGSIRVGTTGTISSLITKEMDNRSSAQQHTPISTKRKPATIPLSLPSGSTPRTSLQRRRTADEASSSGSSTSTSNINRRSSTSSARQSTGKKSTHDLPMLGSEDIPLERTPYRATTSSNKKGPNIVEVVDIKCGKSEKSWSTPISSRLKKLGFSKLSVSIG
ncbi:hypothetical protein MKW98_023963 [Papaver atlanticum]|uniref:Uncharacterized protein n=1 Tax=Papaver atlanticum TaxID=357466 RepID=A0AAD4SXY7_9MAGN|nr:hypothetical protein MKW98_023963 [Papaver atlanticum]